MYNDDFEIMFITRNILMFILIPMILVMYPWYIHKCVYIYNNEYSDISRIVLYA